MIAGPPQEKDISSGESGRAERFAQLFETYQAALRRLAAAYLVNPADREDLVQEIAVGIWQSLPRFRGDSSERTWIYRIAHNIAIRSSSQARARTTREPSMPVSYDVPCGGANAEETLVADERRRALMDGVRALAIVDRQVITLHLEGLSAAEIEEVTGISSGAVATRLTRIRQKLADQVKTKGVKP